MTVPEGKLVGLILMFLSALAATAAHNASQPIQATRRAVNEPLQVSPGLAGQSEIP